MVNSTNQTNHVDKILLFIALGWGVAGQIIDIVAKTKSFHLLIHQGSFVLSHPTPISSVFVSHLSRCLRP